MLWRFVENVYVMLINKRLVVFELCVFVYGNGGFSVKGVLLIEDVKKVEKVVELL